jgi:hypothetical protein
MSFESYLGFAGKRTAIALGQKPQLLHELVGQAKAHGFPLVPIWASR